MKLKRVMTHLLLIILASISLSAQIDSSLILYMNFDGYCADSSVYRMPVPYQKLTNYVVGVKNQAVKFNGIKNPNQIKVDNTAFTNFKEDSVSIVAWLRLDDSAGQNVIPTEMRHTILSIGQNDYFHLWLYKNDGDLTIQFQNYYGPNPFGDTSGTFYAAFGAKIENYKIGDWFHLAVVFGKNNQKIYYNGLKVKETELPTMNFHILPMEVINIGQMNDNWYPLNGAIDELKIFKKPLSYNEVQQLYNQYTSVPEEKAQTDEIYYKNGKFHQLPVGDKMQIYNLYGQLITQLQIWNNIIALDLSSGVYFYRIDCESKQISGKFIVE